MSAEQFPPIPQAAATTMPERSALPDWPRLMNERLAAFYLSIGTTMLRDKGPAPKKIGGRTLWDRRDLDRFADALDGSVPGGQPLDPADAESHGRDVERAWLEEREKRKKAGNG